MNGVMKGFFNFLNAHFTFTGLHKYYSFILRETFQYTPGIIISIIAFF